MSVGSSSKCGRNCGGVCDEFFSEHLECFVRGSAHDLLYFRMGEVVRHTGYVFGHGGIVGAAAKRRNNQTKSVSSRFKIGKQV